MNVGVMSPNANSQQQQQQTQKIHSSGVSQHPCFQNVRRTGVQSDNSRMIQRNKQSMSQRRQHIPRSTLNGLLDSLTAGPSAAKQQRSGSSSLSSHSATSPPLRGNWNSWQMDYKDDGEVNGHMPMDNASSSSSNPNDLFSTAEASTSFLNRLAAIDASSSDEQQPRVSSALSLDDRDEFMRFHKHLIGTLNNQHNSSSGRVDNMTAGVERMPSGAGSNAQQQQRNNNCEVGGRNSERQHVFTGRHTMWSYFDVSRQHTGFYYCQCTRDCTSSYTWPPSTTVAGRHLRDRHPEIFLRIMEVEAARKLSTEAQQCQQQTRTSGSGGRASRKRPATSTSPSSATTVNSDALLMQSVASLFPSLSNDESFYNGSSNKSSTSSDINNFPTTATTSAPEATFTARAVKEMKIEEILDIADSKSYYSGALSIR